MNPLTLPSWALQLGALVLQVSLWLAFGLLAAGWASRRGPRAAAEVATGVLGGVLLLSVLSLAPWPSWYPLPEPQRDDLLVDRLPARAEPLAVSAAPPAQAPRPVPSVGEPHVRCNPGPIEVDTAPAFTVSPAAVTLPEPIAPTWLKGLAGCLLVLTGFCLSRLALAVWAVRECRRRSTVVDDAALHRLCTELQKALGVRRGVELRELGGLGTPATVGWRRPLILLPNDWTGWNDDERRSVLAHELAHIRGGDYAGWLLAQLSAALHGYHPLMYWLVRRLRRDQELAADELAARAAGGAAAYAQALCRLALRRDENQRLGLARAFLPAQVSLTRRVEMVLARKHVRKTTVSPWCRLGLGTALVTICLLLAGLRNPVEAEESPQAPAVESPMAQPKAAKELAIAHRLNQPLSVELRETPLDQAIDKLRELTSLNIVIDRQALDDEGISVEQPISIKLENVALRSALTLLLKQASLVHVVKDEVLQVTTQRAAFGKMVQRTYPVADLIVPVDNPGAMTGDLFSMLTPSTVDGQKRAATAALAERQKGTSDSLEEKLIRLILTTIAPQSWSEAGGPGTLDYHALGMALVINQTATVQEQIRELLEALRHMQDLEVSVEFRVLSVPTTLAPRLRKDFGIDCTPPANKDGQRTTSHLTTMKDAEVFKLMESLQGVRQVNVLQAPKLTLFNGQTATVQIEDFQWFLTGVQAVKNGGQVVWVPKNEAVPLGQNLTTRAVVSADRRSVRLKLSARIRDLVSEKVELAPLTTFITPVFEGGAQGKPEPFTQYVQVPEFNTLHLEQELSLPDGHTAVLSGWEFQYKRASGKPLKPVPKSGQEEPAQKGQSAETSYIVLLATPRVIQNNEADPHQTGVNRRARVPDAALQQLLKRYDHACGAGRLDEARKLAAQALALDPACFTRKR